MNKRLIAFSAVIALALFSLNGCGNNDSDAEPFLPELQEEKVTEIIWDEEPGEDVIDFSGAEVDIEEFPEGMTASTLTGLAIPEETAGNRPLAVMIGNTTEALPQYGLSQADILYEVPVEGGITRLMAIFGDYSGLTRIGCVRSARLYFAEIATEYDAMYCHFGQAPYAESYLNSGAVTDLNGLSGTVGGLAFYRTSDKKAPHNAYVSEEGINAAIEKMGYRTRYDQDFEQHFSFSSSDYTMSDITESGKCELCVTGYNLSNTRFEYNEEEGVYYRFHYKREHVDAGGSDDTSETQLSYTNVIIMSMNGKVIDNNGYMEFDTVGSGTGVYLCDGKRIDVVWSKDSLKSHSRFSDAFGKELVLKPGKTAICVIDDDNMSRVSFYETLTEYTNG